LRRKNDLQMNPKNKANGHGALLTKSSGANGNAISLSEMGRAASVDASELSVANASASSAAARADRKACAEVAQAQGEGKQSPAAGTVSRSRNTNDGGQEASEVEASRKIPPGLEPLPIDGEAFVDAVHSRVDLVLLEVKLLKSRDDKIVQRELAYLRELRYGKRAPAADDGAQQFIFDAPRPERDMP
jgi:hypothetical protein